MSQLTRHFVLLFLLGLSKTRALPMASDSESEDEIVLVEEMVRYTDFTTNSTATLITLNGGDIDGAGGGLAVAAVAATEATEEELHQNNESVLDTSAGASDDLIFITAKKPTHLQEQQQKTHHRGIHQIGLLTVEDVSPFSAESSATSCETENMDDTADVDGAASHEIELHTGDLSSQQPPRPNINMTDFVTLIPADEVKSIVANYYRNDPEVQRAYAYLSGREFAELKQRIIMVPEMSSFLRYLNASGLDVIGFLYTITNLTTKPSNEKNRVDHSQVNGLGAESSANGK